MERKPCEDILEHRMGALEHKQALRDARCVAAHKSLTRHRQRLIDAVVFSACAVALAVSIVGAVTAFWRCLP